MLKRLTFDEFALLAKQHPRVVVYEELIGDNLTPISVFQCLGEQMQGASLLESHMPQVQAGRYSYLGFHPIAAVRVAEGQAWVRYGEHETVASDPPLTVVRDCLSRFRAEMTHPMRGLIGGLVGFLSYDAIRWVEAIPDRHHASASVPDLFLRAYRDHFAFDHQRGIVVLATVMDIESDIQKAYDVALERLAAIKKILFSTTIQTKPCLYQAHDEMPIAVELSDEAFAEKVREAKKYIVSGDVFQIVLSRKFERKTSAHPFDIYRTLRRINPSPYLFYLDYGDYVLLGSSPEKLVSVQGSQLETRPLAGTRARGATDAEDALLAEELLADEKEVAEHMMLVDLARNDVGRATEPGSVQVTALKIVERYAHVMHLSSTVSGKLRPDVDALTALLWNFPAGTLSGAPKIRAMELIDQLEPSRRGVYGGAILMLDYSGDLNSCIAIRMAMVRDGVATIQAGAGVVFGSDPMSEAIETKNKAKSLLTAIALAEEEFT